MQFINSPSKTNSGRQVSSAKIPPKNKTKPQEKQELKEMPLTEENLAALSKVIITQEIYYLKVMVQK